MYCPNCQSSLDSTDYCSNCNRELILINNNPYDKESYYQIKNLHDNMDNFIKSAINTENEINTNMNNDDFYRLANSNNSFKEDVLRKIDDSLNSIDDFNNSIIEVIMNNRENYEYVKRMNHLFGDIDYKIGECKKHINILNGLLREYLASFDENINLVPDEAMIKVVHDSLDEFKENILVVEKETTKLLNNQESMELLRYDKNQRENMKKQILTAKESYLSMKNQINPYLIDEDKLNYASYYDFKYGCLKDKMLSILELIDNSEKNLEKLSTSLDKMDNNIFQNNDESDMNSGRKLDF